MATKLYTLQINEPVSGGTFNGMMEVNDTTKIIVGIYEQSDVTMTNLLYPLSEATLLINGSSPYSMLNPSDSIIYQTYITNDTYKRNINNVYDSNYPYFSSTGIVVNSLGSVIDNYAYSLKKYGGPLISAGNVRYYISMNQITVYDKTKGGFNTLRLMYNPAPPYLMITFYAVSCFAKNCLISTIDGDVEIQDIVPGTLIETLTSGVKEVTYVGKKSVRLTTLGDDPAFKIFSYPGGLKVTGKHSVLVDELTEEQEEQIPSIIGSLKQTEGKWLLPVCLDEEAIDVYQFGLTEVYHLVLENDDDDANYGILSHGKWVETCSKNNFDKYVRL